MRTGDTIDPPLKGKYSSVRDELLHDLSVSGWANASSGDVASPTGHFSRISNSEAELPEVVGTFDEDLHTLGRDNFGCLVGHFMVIESSEGFVTVVSYRTEQALMTDYAQLEAVYSAWEAQDEE